MEIVRRLFEVMNQDDPGAAFDQALAEGLIASDLDWRGGRRAGLGVAGVGDAVGRDEIAEFVRTFTEGFDDYKTTPEQIFDTGTDRVAVVARANATGKESRVPVEMRTGMLFTLARDRIVRVEIFIEPDEALRAAGLRE